MGHFKLTKTKAKWRYLSIESEYFALEVGPLYFMAWLNVPNKWSISFNTHKEPSDNSVMTWATSYDFMKFRITKRRGDKQ